MKFIWTFWFIASIFFLTIKVKSETEDFNDVIQEKNLKVGAQKDPYFIENASKNVTVQKGETAILNCRILYVEGKSVAWFRVRDLKLLAIDTYAYTRDNRIAASHQKGSNDWQLKIVYAESKDRGTYFCQVSTSPPVIHTVYLDVLEPKVRIMGGPHFYFHHGAKINLTCIVNHSVKTSPFIFWYRDGKLLNFDPDCSDVSIVAKFSKKISISHLTITKGTRDQHSGNYNCSTAGTFSNSVGVHILPPPPPSISTKDEEESSSNSRHFNLPSIVSSAVSHFIRLLIKYIYN